MLRNLWPFSLLVFDDLRASSKLVHKLSVPDHTKPFIYAVRQPESRSVIYILSVQNLSERSAIDAECLIKVVKPDVVVVQAGHSVLEEIQHDGSNSSNDAPKPVPTSSFGVLKRCFLDKVCKDEYENVAGNMVLSEIFGIGFHGHFLAAKRAAEEVGARYRVLESSLVQSSAVRSGSEMVGSRTKLQAFAASLAPQKVGSAVFSSARRFCITNDLQLQMVKLLCPQMRLLESKSDQLGSIPGRVPNLIHPRDSYVAPPFAQSFYPLLLDLHDIFADLPSIGRALAHAQKLLVDVNSGEAVDAQIVSEVYTFRVAVEGLRIALNNAGRLPLSRYRESKSPKADFSGLSLEEQSHALFAQALQCQAKNCSTVVALVDAKSLAGVRKHWDSGVPEEIKDFIEYLVSPGIDDGESLDQPERKRLLHSKPVVAVGAGATAVIGAASLTKAIPASTFMKIVTLKVPVSLKFMLAQSQKAMTFALSKTAVPSKLVAPGLASSGSNSAFLNAAASAEKIRTVVHSIIASAEKTSFSAMRTALYEIMRKRRMRPIGILPWATFGCSIATCSGLLVCGDGIECAAESFPAASSIASLGRGIQSLHQASEAVMQNDGNRIQKSIETLMYRLKKMTI